MLCECSARAYKSVTNASTGSPSSCFLMLNFSHSKITLRFLTKCWSNLALTVSYFSSSSLESLKDRRISSASSPMEYSNVFTCTTSPFVLSPLADRKRSKRRAHFGHSSGRLNVKDSAAERGKRRTSPHVVGRRRSISLVLLISLVLSLLLRAFQSGAGLQLSFISTAATM